MAEKTCKDSLAVKMAHVLPPDTNAHGTLFGGQLMAYVDDVGAIAAVRHCRKVVVTASTDSVDFLYPVKEGNSVCVESFVTWAHKTSMEVFTKVMTENMLTGERRVCATAFATFVAIDEDGRPTEVPGIRPETGYEKELNDTAAARAKLRRASRQDSKELARRWGTEFPWMRD